MIFSMTLLLLLTNICVLYAHQRSKRQGNETTACKTPEGQPGQCRNIRDCPALSEILLNMDEDPDAKDFISRLRCGGHAEVCCRIEASNHKIKRRALRNDNVCGKSPVMSTSRIVGGQPAELGAWPWIAALGYIYGSVAQVYPYPVLTEWICGGTLINKRYILTAGHCIKLDGFNRPNLYVVRLGEHDLLNDAEGANPIDYYIEKTIRHNDNIIYQNDIGLVKLKKDVVYSDRIRPICLPTLAELKNSNYEGLYSIVIGWGVTEYKTQSSVLLQVSVPVIDHQSCKKIHLFKNKNQICAGYALGGKGACTGDSGGPLMLPKNGVFYQIGITSFDKGGCGLPNSPAVYTKVSAYLEWIEENMT